MNKKEILSFILEDSPHSKRKWHVRRKSNLDPIVLTAKVYFTSGCSLGGYQWALSLCNKPLYVSEPPPLSHFVPRENKVI